MTQAAGTGSIAFIGGGNMARSLIGGLVAQGVDPRAIRVAEPVDALRDALARDFGVQVFASAAEAAAGASTWVLAVKPQVMRDVCGELAASARRRARWWCRSRRASPRPSSTAGSAGGPPVIRAMPNTPALIGAGHHRAVREPAATADHRDAAEALLRTGGPTAWIEDERLMDAVTAVSGSGPAYVFLLAEAMQAAAERQGLPAETASLLVLQTIAGAARDADRCATNAPAVLRARVTSPGGTTQAAVEALQAGGLRGAGRPRHRSARRCAARELSAAND